MLLFCCGKKYFLFMILRLSILDESLVTAFSVRANMAKIIIDYGSKSCILVLGDKCFFNIELSKYLL